VGAKSGRSIRLVFVLLYGLDIEFDMQKVRGCIHKLLIFTFFGMSSCIHYFFIFITDSIVLVPILQSYIPPTSSGKMMLCFFFYMQKNDEKGNHAAFISHLYANAYTPWLCPILALAIWLGINPIAGNGGPLFPGGNQQIRFIQERGPDLSFIGISRRCLPFTIVLDGPKVASLTPISCLSGQRTVLFDVFGRAWS
jgi:hypothetical protein